MRWKTKHLLLACHDCGVLQPVAPVPSSWEDPTAATDDYAVFAAGHARHRTGWLERDGADTASDRPLWDPLATLTFQATDGRQHYVVTASRESIDTARTYRFVPGILEIRTTEVAVHDGDLRRGLARHFYPHALHPTTVDRFFALVRDVVSHIHPEDLELAFDAADDPDVSIAGMPSDAYDDLLARSNDLFDASEWPRVRRFLSENRGEDGLLALRVRRQIHTVRAATLPDTNLPEPITAAVGRR